jgi:hypothetical protein
MYFDIPDWFSMPESRVMLVFIGLLVLFFSHVIIFIVTVLSIKRSNSVFFSGIVLLIIGTVSFIALLFHWGCLTDIFKEYPAGVEIIGEIKAARTFHIIHATFICYSLIYYIRLHNRSLHTKASNSITGEQLFVSLNITGVVCGLIGLFIVLVNAVYIANPVAYKWAIGPYSIFVIGSLPVNSCGMDYTLTK